MRQFSSRSSERYKFEFHDDNHRFIEHEKEEEGNQKEEEEEEHDDKDNSNKKIKCSLNLTFLKVDQYDWGIEPMTGHVDALPGNGDDAVEQLILTSLNPPRKPLLVQIAALRRNPLAGPREEEGSRRPRT